MKKNFHNIERWVRGLVGLALIGYGYTSSIAWFYLGAYPLATTPIGYCPPYQMLGFNTRKE